MNRREMLRYAGGLALVPFMLGVNLPKPKPAGRYIKDVRLVSISMVSLATHYSRNDLMKMTLYQASVAQEAMP